MITVRRANARGKANFGWLDSRHSFSFGSYYDPNYMGFGNLRVINEDKVTPGKGFAIHSHQNMEIISYVIEGELEHKDSIGNGSIIRPGDIQIMSAGTGIAHSEYNPSQDYGVHFLQIWIIPEKTGLKPSYEQKAFTEAEKQGILRLVGSQDGRDGSVTIHQDVNLYTTILGMDEMVTHNLATNRSAWLQIVKGTVTVNDQSLDAGDGAAILLEDNITLKGLTDKAEILLFDLAS